MGTHDTDAPHDDESNDWHDEWAQRRIADLKDTLADDDGGDLGNSADIRYDDESLDDMHDGDGYYDDSGEDSRAIYAVVSTWWENLLVRLWWRIIPLGALLIPFLILIGILIVLSALSGGEADTVPAAGGPEPGNASPPVQAEWPAGVHFAAHTIPALIRDDLAYAGAARGYEFAGAQGDVWHIEVEPSAGSALDPMARLYTPDGRELASNDNRAVGNPSAELLVTLPQDGAYRLVIQAAGDGLTTGEYWLTVGEQ
jgi:hypothetical protein